MIKKFLPFLTFLTSLLYCEAVLSAWTPPPSLREPWIFSSYLNYANTWQNYLNQFPKNSSEFPCKCNFEFRTRFVLAHPTAYQQENSGGYDARLLLNPSTGCNWRVSFAPDRTNSSLAAPVDIVNDSKYYYDFFRDTRGYTKLVSSLISVSYNFTYNGQICSQNLPDLSECEQEISAIGNLSGRGSRGVPVRSNARITVRYNCNN